MLPISKTPKKEVEREMVADRDKWCPSALSPMAPGSHTHNPRPNTPHESFVGLATRTAGSYFLLPSLGSWLGRGHKHAVPPVVPRSQRLGHQKAITKHVPFRKCVRLCIIYQPLVVRELLLLVSTKQFGRFMLSQVITTTSRT